MHARTRACAQVQAYHGDGRTEGDFDSHDCIGCNEPQHRRSAPMHACMQAHTRHMCMWYTDRPTDRPPDRPTDCLPACLPACLPTRPTDCVHISTKKMREQKRFDIWSGKVYVCGHNEDEIELHKTSVKIRAPPQGGQNIWVRARVLDMFREITRVEISSKRSL